MIQRQVGSRITSPADGLDQKIQRFLDDLKNFKIPNPDAQKQMEQMKASVGEIRQQRLGPAEQGLTRASKTLDGEPAQPASPEPSESRDGAQPQGRAQAEPQSKSQAPSGAQGQAEPKSASKDAAAAEQAKDNQASAGGERSPSQGKSQPDPAQGRQQAQPQPAQRPSQAQSQPVQTALKESETNQKAIADELQKMLDGLSEFETYRGVVKDAQNLLKAQEETMKRAADAAARPDNQMGKSASALTPEQKDDLANLAARQSGLSKELQDLQGKMDDMAKRLDESDPLAGAALREAAQNSRKQGTSARMGEAADQIEKNQMGEARGNQEQVRQDLRELVDSIQNRRERELARLVKELKNAEAELNKLRQRQAENLKKTREARNNPDANQRAQELKRLAKEQAEIQKELDRQLKRLAKLSAGNAARSGQRAAGRMSQAQQNLDQDQGEQAEQEEEEALTDLDEAQDEIAEARRDAEEQLAMEQLVKMADHLKSLSERQDNVAKGAADYEKLREERDGQLTDPQRRGVRSLGRIQEGLKDETGELIEKLEGAPVFSLTLKRATGNMDDAAQRLQALKTDAETQRAARAAAKRFQQLLDALKLERAKGAGGQQGGGQQGGGAGGGGQGDGVPAAAQLKMLKSLQEELNERTDFFEELRRRKKELTPEQTAELDRLHDDQGTLADIARDLTRPKRDDGED
jgi:hypothetical protein